MSSDPIRDAPEPAAPELSWAVAVTQRGYPALHPTPELPRPGAAAQAAAVREAFAPAAPVLAARAVGGAPVEPLGVARSSDAGFWFAAPGDRVVVVVPPFQSAEVLEEVVGVGGRLDARLGLLAIVPVGSAPVFQGLLARLGARASVAVYRSDLQPGPVAVAASTLAA